EGLDLPKCPDFQAWCVAEREETRRLHARLLRILVERHATGPESEAALPHARMLARVDPDTVSAHATLLHLLVASGRQREAEEQRDVSMRLLAETSDSAAGELTRIWRSLSTGLEAANHKRGVPSAGIAASLETTSVSLEDASTVSTESSSAMEIPAPVGAPTPAAPVADAERKHVTVLFASMPGVALAATQ